LTAADQPPSADFRSGFVSILGRPNVGKSTLLNALVGSKVSIVADKPQTTRTSIQAVATTERAQIVFADTPGIHRGDSAINKRMMDTVRAALNDRDALVFVADAVQEVTAQDIEALSVLKKVKTCAILALNKIDLLKDRSKLLALLDRYRSLNDFVEYVPVSAATGEGVNTLRNLIVARLPAGPAYFPADHITEQPERFLAAELVREKILMETRQEVPHAVAVMVDKWEEKPRLVRLFATIYVEKEGQKKILIGAQGAKLKHIGTLARHDIERFLTKKVFLSLHVKVQPGWRENPAFLDALDWRTMAGKDEA